MARSNNDLLALKAELTNDPLTLGLTLLSADDVTNADKLNLVRPAILIDREAIPIGEIFLQIDRDEYVALPEADRDWLKGISVGGTVNPKAGGEVREGILQLFGPATQTRTNLLSIMQEPANRIEQLHKLGLLEVGGGVSPSDIANARNAT